MASSTTTHPSSQAPPLTRTLSPFKNPRPPPCTPAKTAKLWEDYERIALENAKKRERNAKTAQSLRNSASDMANNFRCSASTSRSSFDFKYRTAPAPASTATICKSCKQHIHYTSGICERCKRTIILPSSAGESTPPLSPAARNFASTDLSQLEKTASREDYFNDNDNDAAAPLTPPKRKPAPTGPPPTLYLSNPPIRLSSLQPPPPLLDANDATRTRKVSLTDPNEPFLRLQITHLPPHHPTTHPHTHTTPSIPTTPTYPPTTPPSAPRSSASTRPSSYALASPLSSAYPRHNSVTPSELSTLFPYASTASTTTCGGAPSLHRVSNALQNTTSAWDDWDSEGEGEERVRLIGYGYWKRGRGKDKDKDKRCGSAGGGGGEKGKRKDERERSDSKVSDARSEAASPRASCEPEASASASGGAADAEGKEGGDGGAAGSSKGKTGKTKGLRIGGKRASVGAASAASAASAAAGGGVGDGSRKKKHSKLLRALRCGC